MSGKSFSERVSDISIIGPTESGRHVDLADALQIAKEADEAIAAQAHIIETQRRIYDETSKRTEIIFDPTDPRVEIGREYEFSNDYDFVVKVAGKLSFKRLQRQPFKCLDGYGNNWDYFTFIREVKK